MRRTALPAHRIELTHERLYTGAELYIGDRLVAETTLKPGATQKDAECLVYQYFHLPMPKEHSHEQRNKRIPRS